jgi:phosphoserine phosphatase
LLRNTTASLQIAKRLGCLTDLKILEKSFSQADIDTRKFASAICRLWHGLTIGHVAEAFDAAPWIEGLPDVLADIKKRGEYSLVVTMSPNFFAERLLTIGIDDVVASRFPTLPLTDRLDPSGILTPADKVTATDLALQRYGLSRDECVAYGDSASDVPLFETLSHTVAVNADSLLRGLAAIAYEGDDLREAYHLARARTSASLGFSSKNSGGAT